MKKNIENIVKHAEVSEKAIEAYLVKRMAEIGLPCLKYSNPNKVGYPDRLIVLPSRMQVIWVELKSKGKKPSAIQDERIKELMQLGQCVAVISSKKGVDELCLHISEGINEYVEQAALREAQKGSQS
jgi:predicted RNA polymerase sigma factor